MCPTHPDPSTYRYWVIQVPAFAALERPCRKPDIPPGDCEIHFDGKVNINVAGRLIRFGSTRIVPACLVEPYHFAIVRIADPEGPTSPCGSGAAEHSSDLPPVALDRTVAARGAAMAIATEFGPRTHARRHSTRATADARYHHGTRCGHKDQHAAAFCRLHAASRLPAQPIQTAAIVGVRRSERPGTEISKTG
jgi:hypothetical protein